ncbi:MAG TPA: competence/damage-inducible protein A [Gemmatimonadales bacterium]|nr:competence/damage-inducible protein A [Gemmatimonadales bacterium]
MTIGTELLLGLTIDTNAADLARTLVAAGARVTRKTSVPDEADAVRGALDEALARTRFVVVTGGLGPTRDDVTKRAAADLFGLPLVTDQAYLEQLEARWRRLGRPGAMPEANRTQAEVPAGATVLPNPRGTAPGLWLEDARGVVVLLPGVPHEMRAMALAEVAPRVRARAEPGRATTWRTIRTTGISESAVADRVGPLEPSLAPITVAYLPSFEGVDLRLTAWRMNPDEAERVLAAAVPRVRDAVGEGVYGEGDTDLAAVALAAAARAGARLAVAESCTGGLVGARLTAVPGASAVFAGGVIAYDDAVKRRELEVSADLIAAHGAVSEPVVRAMAAGARRRFGVESAIAVTGIAGPDGGTPEKPVGTVWFCAALGGRERTALVRFPGDRHEVRTRAAQTALDLLRRVLG